MAALGTLTDTFDGAVLDTTKWAQTNGSGNVGSQTGGRYQFAIANNSGSYSYLTSVNTYDLTGSQAFVQLVDAGNLTVGSLEVYPLQVQLDASNRAFFVVSGTFVGCWKTVAGTQTGLAFFTYDPVAHRWFRLRETGGTLFWETSPDAAAWTVLWSEANPFTLTAVTAQLQAGEYAAEPAGATTVLLDHFSVVTAVTRPAVRATSTAAVTAARASAAAVAAPVGSAPAVASVSASTPEVEG